MMNQAEFYASLPKKRMGAGALFFDAHNNVLIVKPTYKEYWLLPGGAVEADESPRQACVREVREELGLDLPISRLLSLEYISARGIQSECLQFIFEGGRLSPEQIAQIVLPEEELSTFRFVAVEEAATLLSPRMSTRFALSVQAFHQQTTCYLENQQLV